MGVFEKGEYARKMAKLKTTRDRSSFLLVFVRMRLLAMLAQLNGCSPLGNESTRQTEVTLFCI